ncbi:MAG: hypothetical protein AB7U20_09115 [Planctomycetaceae bacterium]
MLVPIVFAAMTALFWGAYGPALGNAQTRVAPPEGWSSFKPYMFVGLAYLVLGVGGGVLGMMAKGDTFSYAGEHFLPAKWGFLAGAVGALGALSLTTAMMTSKGNAALVMPIVFGGAVTVNALISAFRFRGHTNLSPMLWLGMAIVAVGIVIVARNAPHQAPKPPSSAGDAHAAAKHESDRLSPRA